MYRDEKGRFTKGSKPDKHRIGCLCFRCSGLAWNKGKVLSQDIKDKISFANKGKKHPETQGKNNVGWKGDKVGYMALHTYVNKHKDRGNVCILCNSIGKTIWANKSYKYKRDLNDWIELCQKCHMKRDKKNGWGVALKRFPDLKRYYDLRKIKNNA